MKRILCTIIALLLLAPSAMAAPHPRLTIATYNHDETEYARLEAALRNPEIERFDNRTHQTLDLMVLEGLAPIIKSIRQDIADVSMAEIPSIVAQGDRRADIHCFMDADPISLHTMGLAIDLGSTVSLDGWPNVLPLLGDGTALYAVPEALAPMVLEVDDADLYNALGLAVSGDTWTWSDLFDIGDALGAYNEANGTQHTLITSSAERPAWLEQFAINEAARTDGAVDTEALAEMLPRWKALAEQALFIGRYTYLYSEEVPGTALFRSVGAPFSDLSETFFLAPVYREGVSRTGVEATLYSVDETSANADLAMAYLNAYCATESVLVSPEYWHSGIFPPEAAIPEKQPAIPATPERIALWNEALETGYLSCTRPVVEACYEALAAYLDDTLTLEACVEQITAVIIEDATS